MNKYLEYVKCQIEKYSSYESDSKYWSSGQKRFIDIVFFDQDRKLKILDICCGDGVGLREFKKMGFKNLTGVDLNPKKIERAKKYGYPVYKSDMHDLSKLKKKSFNIIYSSHSLEHAQNPKKVLGEFNKILKDDGLLVLVLPYPDIKKESGEAHIGREKLLSNNYDDGKKLINFLNKNGFRCIDKFFDTFREPEIWLILNKTTFKDKNDYKNIYKKINDPNYVYPFFLNYQYIQKKFFEYIFSKKD